jgi:tagatose 6-phosphate kinase
VILTVTLNPALDLTYTVEGELAPDHTHRVQTVQSRPGGKGVNVARVLAALGEQVSAVGPGDDSFGAQVAAYGVPGEFPRHLAQVRRSIAVVSSHSTTVFNEPGTRVTPGTVEALTDLVDRRLDGARVLVVSGSLAPGLPDDLPVALAAGAVRRGIPAILDLDDAPLAAAALAGGAILMPNEHELARLLGLGAGPSMTIGELAAAVGALARRTGAPIIATLGARGLIAAAGGEVWHALAPERVTGNPTGAGDATAAGVALGLSRSLSWPDILPLAVALGAAAVRAPVAGEVDLAAYHRWVGEITVRRLDPTPSALQES